MKSLKELNKINSIACQLTEQAQSFDENMAIFNKYKVDVEAYRNALLKSLLGKEVTIKGYLTAQHKASNYTLTCVEIYIGATLVDKVHHLNIYKDILTKGESYVNGIMTPHYGDYDHRVIIRESMLGLQENIPPSKLKKVTCRGIVYSYRNKWSVGSRRQAEYAQNL